MFDLILLVSASRGSIPGSPRPPLVTSWLLLPSQIFVFLINFTQTSSPEVQAVWEGSDGIISLENLAFQRAAE